ncbi:endonuclease [Halobacteriales archaeon QS_8_69_26]|nr:MAG: endonuclease [Halobacteriales archaeon QS_8_69_26]
MDPQGSRALAATLCSLLLVSAGCLAGGGLATDPTTTPDATGEEWTVTVEKVIDGDTFRVRFPDGSTDTVRLLGVDTPEVHVSNQPEEFEGVPDTEAGHAWLRDWGHKASEFARQTVADEEVRIAVDETADRRGSFGRLLVYVYSDGDLFNRQLIDQGYASVYPSTFAKRSAFEAAERTAREEGIGVWGFDGSAPPTPTPAGDGPLAVATVHADAAGDDRENLNDEYVVFENVGEEPLDLSGWTVEDEAGHTYAFPDGFVLDLGDRVTLHTGSGADTDSDRYWGAGGAVWNNGGDVVVVRNADGEVVLSVEYS